MTYRRLLERLFRARRAGVDLGLERVERCLAALGHPEARFAARVHVGGTNGKGSTVAFVDAMVRRSGRRTGRFTSPHLSQFCERFCVDGQPVARDQVVAAGEAVRAAGGDELTFFEQATVMALWLFARAEVHTAILEVGLGGRLDATNAVRAEVAAVTGVAMDHQEYLGDTLAEIAAEKAGIFKPGQRVVIGRAGEPEAVPWLVERARGAGAAALTVVDGPVPADWELGLGGAHQRDNAAAALAIVEHLAALGLVEADRAAWRRGLAEARLPGRMDVVARSPRTVVDGAHNAHAARVLARALVELPAPRILVLSVCRGKDAAGIAAALAERVSAVIVTRASSPRALSVAELDAVVAEVAPHVPRLRAATTRRALARARALAGAGGAIVAAGSLFLAGEVRQLLCGDRADAVAVSDPLGGAEGPARASRGRKVATNPLK